jgi:adenosine deaminase
MNGLSDIHNHLSGATPSRLMYRIAIEHGIKLPPSVDCYKKFLELTDTRGAGSLDNYLKVLHVYMEKIQSSVMAIEECTYAAYEESYLQGVNTLELRFNPFKRNKIGGLTLDVDAIIRAAIRGMDRAKGIFDMDGGLIICMGRDMDYSVNKKIKEKAENYNGMGVIGIDVAGPQKMRLGNDMIDLLSDCDFDVVTCHMAEIKGGEEEAEQILSKCSNITRIGHGINGSQKLYDMIRERDITLEVCPSSNVSTKAVKSYEELSTKLDELDDLNIKYEICTDGNILLETSVAKEMTLVGR